MSNGLKGRLRSRWWLAVALAAAGIVVALAVLRPWEGGRGGAASVEEAATAYIDALNRRDVQALRDLSGPDPAVEAGIQRRLAAYGGRNIRLTNREIEQGEVVPHHGSARLTGTMTTETGQQQAYQEFLRMNRFEGRWHIELEDDLAPPTGPFPLPPAGTQPPR
jgi:hypothetical protein